MLIVQSDWQIILDSKTSQLSRIQTTLLRFAQFEQCPGDLHIYRMTPLSLWNAVAFGMKVKEIIQFLQDFSERPLPLTLVAELERVAGRYGRLRIEQRDDQMALIASDQEIWIEVCSNPSFQQWLELATLSQKTTMIFFEASQRGFLKKLLTRAGFPVVDEAGYSCGGNLPIVLNHSGKNGPFSLHDYQEEAQRLGRILRAKSGDNRAFFYSITSMETCEEQFAMNRQLFLLGQGYPYTKHNWDHFKLDGEVQPYVASFK